MQTSLLPFNIDLLILNKEMLTLARPVTVLDIFDGSNKNSKNFHPDGLFSVETFGRVGDERRNRKFSYIDLRLKVFHPVIYKAIIDSKRLYADIMAGTGYAVWDEELKDFEKASPLEGDTGFSFFLKHFNELVFEQRDSTRREFNIAVIEKYKNNCLMDKIPVSPAGIRDYLVDEQGKPSEDEINNVYRKILSYANLVTEASIKLNPESTDQTRQNIQAAVNEVYNYYTGLLEGKKKLILGKVAARRIDNGTRNVISSLNNVTDELGSPLNVGVNHTVVGLYQFAKSIMPLARYKLKNGFLSKVFVGPNSPCVLVNMKTLKKEMVNIDPAIYDEWATDEGLEKIITRFGENDLRHSYLKTASHYMGLIYKGPDMTYKLFQDIDDLPSNLSRKDVYPITFAELLYLSIYEGSENIPCFVTRYPIAGYGGIYPSFTFLKTTIRFETRRELDDDWKPTDKTAWQFPIIDEDFMDSLSPSPAHLARLAADYDGDMCSANMVYTDEAIAEVKKLLNSRKYYIGPNGRMNFSIETDTLKYVLSSITGTP